MGNTANLFALCRSCAEEIYATRAPNERYALAVAQLLAGTAATESHFQFRRQHGFGWTSDGGAWGLWQTEYSAVSDSIKYLRARPELLERAAAWLYAHASIDLVALIEEPVDRVLRMIMWVDALACLFCRLHYLRFPAAVPAGPEAQAHYWKRYYNTIEGAGTPQKYLANYQHYVGDRL